MRRLRNDDAVVKHAEAKRRDQLRILDEGVRRIRDAIAVGVLQHHDAVAFLAMNLPAIVDAFRNPDAPGGVGVDVRRIEEQRRFRPEGYFEPIRHLDVGGRNVRKFFGARE